MVKMFKNLPLPRWLKYGCLVAGFFFLLVGLNEVLAREFHNTGLSQLVFYDLSSFVNFLADFIGIKDYHASFLFVWYIVNAIEFFLLGIAISFIKKRVLGFLPIVFLLVLFFYIPYKFNEMVYRDEGAKSHDWLCPLILNPEAKEHCVTLLTMRNQSPEKCGLTGDDGIHDRCLMTFVWPDKNSNDVRLCEQMKKQYWHDVCYQDIARRTNNFELCSNIIPTKEKRECINNAIDPKKAGDCYPSPRNQFFTDICLAKLARTIKDNKMCNFISSGVDKYLCLRDFNF